MVHLPSQVVSHNQQLVATKAKGGSSLISIYVVNVYRFQLRQMPLIEQFSDPGQLSLRTLMYQTPGESVAMLALARESPVVTNAVEPPDRPDKTMRAVEEKSLHCCETEIVLLSEKVVVSS